MNIKTLLLLSPALLLCSCEMDFYRSDTMTSAMLKNNPGSAVYTTDGNYSMLKDVLEYNGAEDTRNTWVRHYFQMTEFRGDNICLSGRTEDPLYEAITYTDNQTTMSNGYFWYCSYKIIYGANANIESLPEGVSSDTDHVLGENYFLRAMAHFSLVNLYAKPYSRGADNEGVVLRTSTDCSTTARASVGEVYEQIEKDLVKAAELMKGGTVRGDNGFAGYDAARGLLTRVYLYMGRYDDAIALADEMLGSAPASHLESDIADYYANTRTSKETLWCIGMEPTDHQFLAKGQLASMYYSPDGIGSTGWCEMYASDPLLELFERYPQDRRYTSYFSTSSVAGDGSVMIHWPVADNTNSFRGNNLVTSGISYDEASETYSFNTGGVNYTVRKEMRDGYPVWCFGDASNDTSDNDGFEGGTRVYVRSNIKSVASGSRNSYPAYMCSKFSYQDGNPMLSSPAFIRWAEVILNRAESYAHKGDVANALADVNIIRARAGLSGDALFADAADMAAKGYSDVLDVVLDERRLEFCYEGQRAFDLYRNGKSIDRRFAGVQTWEVMTPERLDEIFPYTIPYDETSVSGITNNR